ncbi:MAG TPA: hypothetical protein VGI83_04330, partial [Gemmatimonadales bacterium]
MTDTLLQVGAVVLRVIVSLAIVGVVWQYVAQRRKERRALELPDVTTAPPSDAPGFRGIKPGAAL